MAAGLITKLQQALGMPEIYKLDKASRQLRAEAGIKVQPNRFAQSVIPATIIALAAYARTDGGALAVLQAGQGNNWVNYLFTDKRETITRRIASYCGYSLDETCYAINNVAAAAIDLVRQQVNETSGVKELLQQARDEAMDYLPADIQLAELPGDNTLNEEDEAKENQSPNIMQSISGSLKGTDTDEVK